MIILRIILLLICPLGFLSWGQNNYNLSSNYVESIQFDKSGNLWIGTDEGLNLLTDHDQYQFYADISNDRALLNSEIYKLTPLENGLIAAFSINGLSIFQPETFDFKQVELESSPISIYFNPFNQIYWVTTEETGIVTLDRNLEIINRYKFDPLNPISISSSKFSITNNKNIIFQNENAFIGSTNGFNFFNGEQLTFKRFYANNNNFSSNQIKAVFKKDAESLLVITPFQFYLFDISRQSFESLNHKIDNLGDVLQVSGDKYIFSDGSKIQILKFDQKNKSTKDLIYQFDSEKLVSLKRTEESIFIFSSDSKIISKYDIKNNTLQDFTNPFIVNDVTLENSKIIVGSNFGVNEVFFGKNLVQDFKEFNNLFFYDNNFKLKVNKAYVEYNINNFFKRIEIPNYINIDKNTLFEINENFLFIVDKNIHLLNLNTGSFVKNLTTKEDYFGGAISAIKLIDDFLFVSTGNGVIRLEISKSENIKNSARVSLKEYEFNSLLNKDVPKSFSDIEKIGDYFFVGSENDGLSLYKNDLDKLVKKFDYEKGNDKTLSSKSIVKIFFEEKSNSIFLATRGSGLFTLSLNDSIFKNYNINDGLLSNNVNDFLNSNDNIWIQSGNGINFFKNGVLRNVSSGDGMNINSFHNESLHSVNNEILVLGHDNSQVFNPENITKDQFKDLQINLLNIVGYNSDNEGKIISKSDSLNVIDNSIKSIELNLYTNATNKTDLIQYSYKTSFGNKVLNIENFGNKINLNSLPFYESEIEVYAQDGNGNKNSNELILRFYNNPPWWLRTEIIIFYIIFLMTLVYSLVKLREKQTKKRMEGERKSKELEEARKLQSSLLPKTNPKVDGYEISTYLKSATEIGGDYYDFFYEKDNYFYAICGDATGHGVISGIMVSVTKAGLNGIPLSSPSKILQKLNGIVKRVNFGRLRMSLSVAKLNKDSLELSSAAMPPTYYFNSKEGKVEEILVPNLPLGGIQTEQYDGVKLDFKKGDVVVMISDGLPEQPNSDDEILDYQKVEHCVRKNSKKDAESIKNALVDLSIEWANGVINPDDITIVVIKKAA